MADSQCVIDTDGSIEWWLNDKLHREDGPAVIWPNGRTEWWLHGKVHRKDGPAISGGNSGEFWMQNGMMHREDGPAYISNGSPPHKEWWLKGIKLDPVEVFLRKLIVGSDKDNTDD